MAHIYTKLLSKHSVDVTKIFNEKQALIHVPYAPSETADDTAAAHLKLLTLRC